MPFSKDKRGMDFASTNIRSVKANNNAMVCNSPTGHRRRVLPHTDESASSSTLLPTTFSPQNTSNIITEQFWRNPFTTFLLGGTYYPGKDKMRRELKRRTLWYRVFCSSRWRKALSFLVIGLFLFSFVVRPFAGFVIEYGKLVFPRRRTGLHGTWLLHDESLLGSIRTIEEERAEASRLANEQQRLQFGSEQMQSSRLQTLERIVPGWYHRNDVDADKNQIVKEKLKEAERIIEQREAPRVKKDPEKGRTTDKHDEERHISNPSRQRSDNKGTREQQQKHRSDATERLEVPGDGDDARNGSEKRRLANASFGHATKVVRSIHNMHMFHNKSSCPREIAATDVSVTLVLQSTPERLDILDQTCQRWTGPIILVVALPERDSDVDYTTLPEDKECPQLRVFQHVMDSALGENDREKYPVNRLRNLGLDQVQTSHVLMADIDFVPSMDLANLIQAALAARNSLRARASNATLHLPPEEREALVVPAFEKIPPSELCDGPNCPADTKESLSKLVLPGSFEELRSCVLEAKTCRVFQSHNNWDGHSSTRSKAWLDGRWYEDNSTALGLPDTTAQFGRVRTLKCFDSARYEPYVVLRWCPSVLSSEFDGPVAPYYDERFHGYGKNKIELISHLRIMGYTFAILPEGFIIHAPHSVSRAKKAWESTKDSSLHQEMDHLYPNFLKELVTMYKHEKNSIIKPC